MTPTQERDEIVKTIVRETIEERFKDEFVFDPIVVIPTYDEWGDGNGELYLEIIIVFDGDQKRLDPGWTVSLVRRIEPKLIAEGIEEFPSPTWVNKSEWRRISRKLRDLHPELNLETA